MRISNIATTSGRTALHYAVENGYEKTVEILVNFGATNKINDEGDTPLINIERLCFKKNPGLPRSLRSLAMT